MFSHFRCFCASILGSLLVLAAPHPGALAQHIDFVAIDALTGLEQMTDGVAMMKVGTSNSDYEIESLQYARAGAGKALTAIEVVLAKNPDYVVKDPLTGETAKAADIKSQAAAGLEELNEILRTDLKKQLAAQESKNLGEADFPKLVQLVPGGDLNAIRAEIDRTGRPDAHYQNQTALLEAAKRGKTGIIDLLAEKGADFDWVTWTSSPLSEAAKNGHADAARRLIKHGADFDRPNGKNLNTPLIDAIQKEHEDVILALVEEGADVTIVDWRGSSPLDWARHKKMNKVVRLLEFELKGKKTGYTAYEVLKPFGAASQILQRNNRELAEMEKAVSSVNNAPDPGCTQTRKLDKDIKEIAGRLETFGDKGGAAQADRIYKAFVKGAKQACLNG
ncbi:ankyrin repeat domain-containing protein [Roseibium suaedae]|uniref:Ankyrin repeat-containing protein n=1 Tax=Roseibium suaedae TaxID=735517 RepID=A0A1M6YY02_9HYPH|nr:ankyrin repeat domain-containing protein [Roseibium suaedae]SHL23184.1 Ankyrin repeat-containing protein [Roseibium suaedae]